MASKYDEFWARRSDQLAELLRQAIEGESSSFDASRIRELGNRASWYGLATIKGGGILDASMAHMKSLARTILSSEGGGIIGDVGIRLRMSADCLVTARHYLDTSATKTARSPRPTGPKQRSLRGRGDQPRIDSHDACVRIHWLIERLPVFMHPDEVPFDDGLYFFFERGQTSPHAPKGRIVRVGNHPRTDHRLKSRLREHFRNRPNAKNGSVLRRYIGGALIRSSNPLSDCLVPGPGKGHWEQQGRHGCSQCTPVEEQVSTHIVGNMSFRCVRVRDTAQRNRLEEALIATLAACEVCGPTSTWLGGHCYSESVRNSGLWNSEYVEGDLMSAAELDTFKQSVQASISTQSSDLRTTLLIIPCCSSKNGARDPGLQEVSVVHRIDPDLATRVTEGRKAAFLCHGTYLDSASEQRPALAWYTGQPYETDGVRDLLTNAIRDGLHCLIVSGGYGVLMAQEPIHQYGAHLQRTKKVWRRIIPQVISDYVARNGIRRTFTVVSSGYAEVIPMRLSGDDWRAIPSFDRDQDSGSAMRVVPARVGALLKNLLLSNFEPTDEWEES